ncbi:hypothetical protein SAMN05216308_10442 [Nitrosospira sp. Nsp13]|nr:hypothetical protein SAMN05216308_10442 [Nitrosospira sp. Nsp13]
MIHKDFLCYVRLTFWVSPLQGGSHGFYGAWQRCNALPRTPKNRTLHPVQLPDLG